MATYTGKIYNVLGNVIPNDTVSYKFYAEVTYTQSVTNNTTTFTIKPYVYDSHGFNGTWYFKLDGSTYHTKVASTYGNNPDTVDGGTATKTVTHNADGTKTVTLNIGFETSHTKGANNNLNTYIVKSGTISVTITLPTIPRASSFSFSGDLTMSQEKKFTISSASSSFTHTFHYNFGSKSGDITVNGNSASWTPSKDLGHQIPYSTSGVGTLALKTYSGGTHIGTTTQTFTLWVAGDMYPSFSSLQLTGNNLSNGSYVQTISSVTATIIGETTSYGSPIASHTITGHGLNVSAVTGTSSILNTSGNVTYTATITDARVRSATKTATIYVVPYQKPTVSIRELYRCDANGNAHNEGGCVKLTVDYTFADPNNTLTKKYDVKYKQTDIATWTIATSNATISSASGTITQVIQGINVTKTYDISITIKDNYYESAATSSVGAATCLLNIEPTGLGVGKYHQNGILDISGDVYLNGTMLHEEGTFSPSFYCGDGTSMVFTRREGRYQKIGKWCHFTVSLQVEYFVAGSSSSQLSINNFPFVNAGTYTACAIGYCKGIKTGTSNNLAMIGCYIRPNESQAVFVYSLEDGSIGTVNGSRSDSLLDIQISGCYKIQQ
jgi:hypothetical protein